MKKLKYFIVLLASLSQFMLLPFTSAAQVEVIDYTDNGEILGIASAFGVFAKEDVGFNGCDLEARLACGGNANIGAMEYYSTARCGGASVICQGDTLTNFDTGDRLFAVGPDTKVNINTTNIVRGNWIDFEKEFDRLEEISWNFIKENNGSVLVNENWNKEIDFQGNSQVNYFEISSELIDSDNFFFNFDVPEDSYSIVNIKGNKIYTQLYGCSYAGRRIASNSDPLSKHILFNFLGNDLEIVGNGTLYGTILAPKSYVHDSITEGAHCTGNIICNSFLGGIEIGGKGYDQIDEEDNSSTDSIPSIPDDKDSIVESVVDSSSLIFDSSDTSSDLSSNNSMPPQQDFSEDSTTSSMESDTLEEDSTNSSIESKNESQAGVPSSSTTTPTEVDNYTPYTGDRKGSLPENFVTCLILLAVLTIIGIISKFMADKDNQNDNDRDEDK